MFTCDSFTLASYRVNQLQEMRHVRVQKQTGVFKNYDAYLTNFRAPFVRKLRVLRIPCHLFAADKHWLYACAITQQVISKINQIRNVFALNLLCCRRLDSSCMRLMYRGSFERDAATFARSVTRFERRATVSANCMRRTPSVDRIHSSM